MEFSAWLSKWQNSLLLGILLEHISKQNRYGGELIEYARSTLDPGIKIPTVYAILKRTTDHGITEAFISDEKAKVTRGTRRKYYRLTAEGEEYLDNMKKVLRQSQDIIDRITGENK